MSKVRFVFHDGLEAYLDAPRDRMLERTVAMVEDDAKTLVPVDEGDLKQSIHGEVVDGHGTITAGTDHAIPVEMGTSTMAAQPYMAPALFQKRSL